MYNWASSEDEAAMASWPRRVLEEQFGSDLDALIQTQQVYDVQNDAVEAIIRASAHGIAGLPTAVQCVSLPWKEETCLRVMHELQLDSQRRVPRPLPVST